MPHTVGNKVKYILILLLVFNVSAFASSGEIDLGLMCNVGSSSGGITALTGDVTASGTGSVAASVVRLQGISVSSVAPTDGQVLRYNGTTTKWEAQAVSGTGTVTSVASGTGLTGGPITTAGTLNVDVGTAGSKIVQLTAGAQYPAVDGNLITNLNIAGSSGYVNGGNAFGANATIGLTDNYTLSFLTNNSSRVTIDSIGNVGLGTTVPDSLLELNKNAAVVPGTLAAGTLLHLAQADTVNSRISIDAFGTSADSGIAMRKARGTAASPSAIQSNDRIGALLFSGYGTSSYSTARVLLGGFAAENWTNTAQGSYFTIQTTPTGSATAAERMRIDALGNVGIGNTAPAARLEVDGASGATLKIVDGNQAAGFVLTSDSAGQASWQAAASGSGTVTSVVSGTGLVAGTITTSGTLSIDVGTSASKIVQLTAGAKYPAVDGYLITNVNAQNIQGVQVATNTPTAGQFLGWNSTTSKWQPLVPTAYVSSVSGTPPIASSGGLTPAISISQSNTSTDGYLSSTDWNTFNGKQASGNYITALTGDVTAAGPGSSAASVVKIQGKSVASAAPTDTQILIYNSTTTTWVPGTIVGDGSITNLGALTVSRIQGKSIASASPTDTQVLIYNSTTSTWVPGTVTGDVSMTNLGAVTVTKIQGSSISTVVPTDGQVLTFNGTSSKWEARAVSGTGTVTSVALTVPTFLSVAGSPITTSGTLAVTLSGTALPIANGGTGATTLTGANIILKGGNAFGANTTIGTTDNFTLALLTNNNVQATVDAAGNVGIGTSTPQAQLHTTGTVRLSNFGAGAAIFDAGGNLSSGTLTVAKGGTGQTTLTNHGVLVGAATTAITQLAAGTAGQALLSGGASADPAYSTPTYPSASGTAGKVLRSDGTNNVYSTFTIPNTAVTSDLLYASATNVWSSLAKSNTSALISDSSGVPAWTSGGTANRLLRTDGTSITFAQAALATDVSGTLAVGNGGTGATTLTGANIVLNGGNAFGANSSIGNTDNFTLALLTNNNARMTITAAGKVGIGTVTPQTQLEVAGTLRLEGATSGFVGIAPAAAAGSITYTLPSADGSSGQFLSTNGSATLSWATASGSSSSIPTMQIFTASGTFTIPAGITKVKVTVVGGGGGSGGASQGSAMTGGGGGGGTSIQTLTGLTPGNTVTVTVGAGGSAGANSGTDGGNGGTSSFGANASATGGLKSTGSTTNYTGTVGGAGGIGSSGDINFAGGAGGTAAGRYSSGAQIGGQGGSSFLGGGGVATISAAGTAGRVYGGGAGGASGIFAGAAGAAGIVIVEY